MRLVQDFSIRYPLVDGQGNFGSVDGDNAAAMRYTEVRMARLADELLADIDKETVDFGPNYDDSLKEPLVLPAKFPNLLVNGSSGIAVGMATNIPPHNLREIIDATILLIENPEATLDDLMALVPGPDFPTAGFIYGRGGIRAAYQTGRGIVIMRARAAIEKMSRDREAIIVTEIPYQINKAKLIERIAELVRDKKLEGISRPARRIRPRGDAHRHRAEEGRAGPGGPEQSLQAHSDAGELRHHPAGDRQQPAARPERCAKRSTASSTHRKDVVRRRTMFELRKAEARAHILEGLKRALDMLDAIIALIRASKEPAVAKQGLMAQFQFSAEQAQAILDMRLQRLTGLEREKIIAGIRRDPQADRAAEGNPGQREGARRGDHRGAARAGQELRRRAPHRDRRRRSRNHPRRPHRRRGCCHHGHPLGLHQADRRLDLPHARDAAARDGSG